MGVPQFYKWVVQRYPIIRKRLSDFVRPRINNFYLDFNTLVYTAINVVDVNSDADFIHLFNEIGRFIDLLVQILHPEDLIFIAVDGPAPLAKCSQQRTRRFMSTLSSSSGFFDRCAISVGTEFMENLHNYLMDFIKERQRTDPTWSKPKIIYSSHRVPGEAEHKFFEYIRHKRTDPDWNPNAVHCVYSPDADLIFLTLQTQEKNFFLMRNTENWRGGKPIVGNGHLPDLLTSEADFEFVTISLLRECLLDDFGLDQTDKRFFDDFAAISYLLGNDFIPHSTEVEVINGDFDKVLNLYKSSFVRKGKRIVNDHEFIKENLKDFLIEAACTIINVKEKRIVSESEAMNIARMKVLKENPLLKEEDIRNWAFECLDAYHWVLHYYTKGVLSWTWQFPKRHSLGMALVSQYVDQYVPNFTLDRPPTTFEQLMCILPPQQKNLVPEQLRFLFEPTSPIGEFYPAHFETELERGRPEYMREPIIPIIDVHRIREIVDPIIEEIPEDIAIRNKPMRHLMISQDGDEEIVFDGDVSYYSAEFDDFSTVPCFPTLLIPGLDLHFSKTSGVTVFLFESSNESSVIDLPVNAPPSEEIIGYNVLVGYPYLIPGTVESVHHGDFKCLGFKDCKGVELAHVIPFVLRGVDYDRTVKLDDPIIYPTNFLLPLDYVPNIERFGSPSCIISPGTKCYSKSYKRLGVVESVSEHGVTLVLPPFKEIDTEKLRRIIDDDDKYWMPLSEFAEMNDLPENTKFFSSIKTPKNECNFDFSITLCDKKGRDYFLEGHAKPVDGKVYVNSDMVQGPLDTMMSEFGDYFEIIKNIENITTISPSRALSRDPEEEQSRVTRAIKSLGLSKFRMVKNPKFALQTFRSIENLLMEAEEQEEITATVQEDDILLYPLVYPSIKEGDIVFSTARCGSVPYGTIGVVVTVDNTTGVIDAISIDELKFGTQLRSMLTTFRGFSADVVDVLKVE